MKHSLCAAALIVAACSGPSAPEPRQPKAESGEVAPADRAPAWESSVGAEGTALRLIGSDGALALSIACLTNPARLAVTAPRFTPVMSEDRFALGLGEEPVTLVADPYRQEAGSGVTGEGPVPGDLAALLDAAGEIRALYGAQQAGPYPAPGADLKARLVEGCAAAR